MSIVNIYNVIGIMSGTSMDGLDCSYIKTDGKNYVSIINEKKYNYSRNYKNNLKKIIKYINNINIKNYDKFIKKNEIFVTNKIISSIKKFIKELNINYSNIDYVGISGQTIYHNPSLQKSIQLGNCKKIQKKLNLKIVGNFRSNDIINGGQGAPIGAFYHKYILDKFYKSSAILNLGGIANITYVNKKYVIAFDTGPANAIIDDMTYYFYKKDYDKDGKKALKGKINNKLISIYKKDKYFKKKYPKSLDRNYFKKYYNLLKKLKKNDSIHNAGIMTIEAILLGINLLNKKINFIILTGGGRKNKFFVKNLKKKLKDKNIKLILIDKLKFNGDFLESQAFAYLAVRCVKKLPLSLPSTTGVKKPTLGGIIYK